MLCVFLVCFVFFLLLSGSIAIFKFLISLVFNDIENTQISLTSSEAATVIRSILVYLGICRGPYVFWNSCPIEILGIWGRISSVWSEFTSSSMCRLAQNKFSYRSSRTSIYDFFFPLLGNLTVINSNLNKKVRRAKIVPAVFSSCYKRLSDLFSHFSDSLSSKKVKQSKTAALVHFKLPSVLTLFFSFCIIMLLQNSAHSVQSISQIWYLGGGKACSKYQQIHILFLSLFFVRSKYNHKTFLDLSFVFSLYNWDLKK